MSNLGIKSAAAEFDLSERLKKLDKDYYVRFRVVPFGGGVMLSPEQNDGFSHMILADELVYTSLETAVKNVERLLSLHTDRWRLWMAHGDYLKEGVTYDAKQGYSTH